MQLGSIRDETISRHSLEQLHTTFGGCSKPATSILETIIRISRRPIKKTSNGRRFVRVPIYAAEPGGKDNGVQRRHEPLQTELDDSQESSTPEVDYLRKTSLHIQNEDGQNMKCFLR